jgi:hypothetical protein
MTTMKAVSQPSVIFFACPECKRQCRLSERQKAVQHAEPTCQTWRAHKTNMQEFLRLALMAAKGNMILGTVGGAAPPAIEPSPEQHAANEKAKAEIIDQLHEGLKKL